MGALALQGSQGVGQNLESGLQGWFLQGSQGLGSNLESSLRGWLQGLRSRRIMSGLGFPFFFFGGGGVIAEALVMISGHHHRPSLSSDCCLLWLFFLLFSLSTTGASAVLWSCRTKHRAMRGGPREYPLGVF